MLANGGINMSKVIPHGTVRLTRGQIVMGGKQEDRAVHAVAAANPIDREGCPKDTELRS